MVNQVFKNQADNKTLYFFIHHAVLFKMINVIKLG